MSWNLSLSWNTLYISAGVEQHRYESLSYQININFMTPIILQPLHAQADMQSFGSPPTYYANNQHPQRILAPPSQTLIPASQNPPKVPSPLIAITMSSPTPSGPVTRIATFRFHSTVTAAQKADRARAFLALYAQHPELVFEGPKGGKPLDTKLELTGVKREEGWDLGFVVVFKVCVSVSLVRCGKSKESGV